MKEALEKALKEKSIINELLYNDKSTHVKDTNVPGLAALVSKQQYNDIAKSYEESNENITD